MVTACWRCLTPSTRISILLDVNMPGLDGLEVYRRLRAREGMADVPVLFVSAGCCPCLARLDGPVRWLAKPFEVTRLLDMAAALVDTAPQAMGG